MQGMPSHCGLRALHAIALGATNHNSDFGNCYYPLRAGYTPGGCSGGSTAAVAAGLCGISLGTASLVRGGQFLAQRISTFDTLLLPTTPHTAFDINAAMPHNQADLTAMANMSGAPAISLPLPVAPGALPVGFQLVGHRGHNAQLWDIAQAVEKALH